MASKSFTSDALVASVLQRCYSTAASDDFSTSDVLSIINEVVDEYLVPFVIRTRRNHFVTHAVFTIPQSGIVQLPSQAVASTIRAIALDIGGVRYPQTEVDLEDGILATNASAGTFLAGVRSYFEGDLLVFVPPTAIPQGTQLWVYWYDRPPLIVLTSDTGVAQITALLGAVGPPGTFRVSATVPAGLTGTVSVDVDGGTSSFSRYLAGVPSTSGAGFFDITGTQPPNLAVGDWVSLVGQAPVLVGCPAEFTRLLCQAAAVRILAIKGYQGKLEGAKLVLSAMETAAMINLRRRSAGNRPALSSFPERLGIHPFYLV